MDPKITPQTKYTMSTEDFQHLAEMWREYIGRKLPPALLAQAGYYVRKMGLHVVELAIIDTAAIPFPSWRYLIAILRNCERDGVRSEQDYIERQARFDGRR